MVETTTKKAAPKRTVYRALIGGHQKNGDRFEPGDKVKFVSNTEAAQWCAEGWAEEVTD